MLAKTNNTFLFETCSADSDKLFFLLSKHIFPNFGLILKVVNLDLLEYIRSRRGPRVAYWTWPWPSREIVLLSFSLRRMFEPNGFCPNVTDLTLGAGEITYIPDFIYYGVEIIFNGNCRIQSLVMTDSFILRYIYIYDTYYDVYYDKR